MLKKLWALFAAVLLLLSCVVAVGAEEETDWSKYDWSQENWDSWTAADFNKLLFNEDGRYAALQLWLTNEASYPELFEYSRYTDGAGATDYSLIARQRFVKDPAGFLVALAQEEEATRKHIVSGIAFEMSPKQRGETIRALETADISREEHPEAAALLDAMIQKVEQVLKEQQIDVTIVNPKTGDGFLLAAAVLLLSAAGLLLLPRKRYK